MTLHKMCMSVVALRKYNRIRNKDRQENCCPICQGALVSPEHFSAEFAEPQRMSRLKADKLIHQASDSWNFMICSTGRLRGGSHLFKASHGQNRARSSQLWNVLMKMSHFLPWLLIAPKKLISNLISHWNSVFSQAGDCDSYRNGCLISFPL